MLGNQAKRKLTRLWRNTDVEEPGLFFRLFHVSISIISLWSSRPTQKARDQRRKQLEIVALNLYNMDWNLGRLRYFCF